MLNFYTVPSVLWYFWLGIMKSIQPVREGENDLHVVCAAAYGPADATVTPSSLASLKSRFVLNFLVPAYPGCPDKETVKRIPVCPSKLLTSTTTSVFVSIVEAVAVVGLLSSRVTDSGRDSPMKLQLNLSTKSSRYTVHTWPLMSIFMLAIICPTLLLNVLFVNLALSLPSFDICLNCIIYPEPFSVFQKENIELTVLTTDANMF